VLESHFPHFLRVIAEEAIHEESGELIVDTSNRMLLYWPSSGLGELLLARRSKRLVAVMNDHRLAVHLLDA
jgi:hypothetical protein